MVRGEDGAPIAPAAVSLTAAHAVYSTREEPSAAGTSHLDQVLPAMRYARGRDFGAAVIHVIDREADSVNHWRQWEADGHRALVRADDRKVLSGGRETSPLAPADGLRRRGALVDAGGALYHGRKARLFVAEAAVILHRPGKRDAGAKKVESPGPPLPLRLVVTEVRDLKGRVLARWPLLTNAPVESGAAAAVARWYHFRWRIEGLHKLLKSAGWQLESWLQRDGQRVLRKLLIALAACASVWALERRHDAGSEGFKALLMQLSGRQVKPGVPVTTSGRLAGLWVLQGALGPLARHGPDTLESMLEDHLPRFAMTK